MALYYYTNSRPTEEVIGSHTGTRPELEMKLRGDRTIIMIAHRLTTVEKCDRIYLMKDGRITDSGRYEELLEHSRDFKRMSLVEG